MAQTALVWVTDAGCSEIDASALTEEHTICCAGGYVQPAALPRSPAICFVWLLILCWIFLGVAMGADVFMGSIEMIRVTSVQGTEQRKNIGSFLLSSMRT